MIVDRWENRMYNFGSIVKYLVEIKTRKYKTQRPNYFKKPWWSKAKKVLSTLSFSQNKNTCFLT